MNTLSLSNITHCYETDSVIKDAGFSANAGELVCLVGPSGVGKTTLLRLIAGLENLQSGEIILGDKIFASAKDNFQLPVQERNVGFVFQQPSLFPHLNVRENIAFGLSGQSSKERKKIVIDLLGIVGLSEYSERYPHTLSGGQQQRVALARSLAIKPSLMLLDEPFANLDYALRREIASEVIGILKKYNIPIVMVTHDPEETITLADKVVMLGKNGGVKQIGSPLEIYNSPIYDEAAEFFGFFNKFANKINTIP